MKIIGSYVCPYVRKVLACMALKGLDDYEIDPITPFFGDEEFARLSPLRRIPVLIHGDLVLTDSSVICAWLDEAYPGHPLLPAAPADRARARWLEEYADTPARRRLHLGAVLPEARPSGGLGRAGRSRRGSRRRWPRTRRRCSTISKANCPPTGFLFGEIGLADIAIASFFRNAAYAGFAVDAGALAADRRLRRPRARPSTASPRLPVRAGADVAPIPPAAARPCSTPARRSAAESLGTRQPRKGIMTL